MGRHVEHLESGALRHILWSAVVVVGLISVVGAQRIELPSHIDSYGSGNSSLYLHRFAFIPWYASSSRNPQMRFNLEQYRRFVTDRWSGRADVVDAYVDVYGRCGPRQSAIRVSSDRDERERAWPREFQSYIGAVQAFEASLYADVMSPTWRFEREGWIDKAGRGDGAVYSWLLELESNILVANYVDSWTSQRYRFSASTRINGSAFENERLVFSRRELWRDDVASISSYCSYPHTEPRAQVELVMALFRELVSSLRPGTMLG